jgi:hypothetical protein
MNRIPDSGQHIGNRICHHSLEPSSSLPACLGDTGQHALESQLTKADATKLKASNIPTGPTTKLASVTDAHLVLAALLSIRHTCF